MSEIERRHPAPFHATSRAVLEAAAAKLDADIPHLQRNQIVAGMMRIAALVGDGHTRIDPRKDKAFGFRSLPLKLYAFDDGLFIRAATSEWRDVVGWRVAAIGGVAADEAMSRAGKLVSADTDSGRKQLAPLYLAMPDLLQALLLSDRTDGATLTLERGRQRKVVTVPVGEVAPPWPSDTDISLITPDGWIDARQAPTPLYLANVLDFHRLVDRPADRLLYAQLNWVNNIEGETLDQYGEHILDRARAMNPRALVLDLRFNQGGNGDLRNGLVADLIKAEDSDTRLFVLTGRGTFSASQFILSDLDRLSNAVIIGEPASSRPSSYGDSFKTILPNSGLAMRTSIKYWQDGQNFDPYNWIDVAAPLSFADYVAGRDPALEAALAYVPPQSLDRLLYEAARDRGDRGASAVVAAYRDAPVNRYGNLNQTMPRAAEKILLDGHKAEALSAAKAVAELLPQSVDAWLVLAEVSLENADNPRAADAARRALSLDPNQRSARALLEAATTR